MVYVLPKELHFLWCCLRVCTRTDESETTKQGSFKNAHVFCSDFRIFIMMHSDEYPEIRRIH